MSVEVHLEKIGLESADKAQTIIDGAPTFLMNAEGVTQDPGYAKRELQKLPPQCTKAQKNFFLIKGDEIAIGVADLVQDYPAKGTAFLGLLLLAEQWQGVGLGRFAYGLLEKFAMDQLGANTIRLAYNETNPVRPFWEKLRFKATGETKLYQGVARESTIVVMEKSLKK